MRLVAVAAGDAAEREAPPFALVLGHQLVADLLDARRGQLDQLREQFRRHRLDRGHDHRLDRGPRFALVVENQICSSIEGDVSSAAGSSVGFVAPLLERGEVERDALAGLQRAHAELAEVLELLEVDRALLEQLEHREEAHDHFELGAGTGREVAEADRARRGQQREHRVDRVAHAGPDRRDVVGAHLRLDLGREAALGRGQEHVERDALERVRRQRSERLFGAGGARNRPRGLGDARVEDLRRVLERLALEQPREQQIALLEPQQLLVDVDVLAAGQQAPGLELHQRGRDQQELGRAVEVDPLHRLDLGAEHVDDAREGDLPEIDLFLEDQVEEEVERPFEDRRRDLVRHPANLPARITGVLSWESAASGRAARN